MKVTDEQMLKSLEAIGKILQKDGVYIGPSLFGSGPMIDGPVNFEAIVQAVADIVEKPNG